MRLLTITAAAMLTATAAFSAGHMSDTRSELHDSTATGAMSTEELADGQGGGIYTTNGSSDEGWQPAFT